LQLKAFDYDVTELPAKTYYSGPVFECSAKRAMAKYQADAKR